MARLIFKKKYDVYEITKKITTISVSSEADIRLPETYDSLCYIEKKDDGFYIETIKGRGIIVNDKQVKHKKLEFGDLISTGNDLGVFIDTKPLDAKLLEPAGPVSGGMKSPPASNNKGNRSELGSLSNGVKKETVDFLIESHELKDVSRAILDKLISETHAEKGLVLLIEDGEPSILVGAEKDGMDLLSGFSETIIKTVLLDKEPLLSNNVLSDRRFSPSKSITALKIMATVVVPILSSGATYGFIYLWNSDIEHTFSETTLIPCRFYAWVLATLIENERLKHGIKTTFKRIETTQQSIAWHGLESDDPSIIALFGQCEKLSKIDSAIVFYGERGTGKKSLAKIIHQLSRPDGYMYVLKVKDKSMEVLADELSILARADSTEGVPGKKGTMVIDGLEYIPENLYPVLSGIIDTIQHARWIFLMENNPDTIEHKLDSRLRARLGEIILYVPPLRDRGSDIELLTAKFLDEFSALYAKDIKGFTEKAENLLKNHTWKGNIEELKNVIRNAIVEAETDVIDADLLNMPLSDAHLTSLGQAKEEFMKRYIKMALNAAGGDKIKAAAMLRVSQRTIYKYLEEGT